MAYEMRAGQGSAFKNDKKTEDWHAPYRGRIMLPDGAIHWLDVTPKKTAAGENWFAVKVGKPVQPGQHTVDKGNAYQAQPNDDIPF